MSKKPLRGKDWTPAPSVKFTPVPFALLRVASRDHGAHESVKGDEFGALQFQPFDPWRKGDLVVLEYRHSSHTIKLKRETYSEWRVMLRLTTPAAEKHRYGADLEQRGIESAANVTLWRIAYRHLHAASKLIGQQFDTREALEAALGVSKPVQVAEPLAEPLPEPMPEPPAKPARRVPFSDMPGAWAA